MARIRNMHGWQLLTALLVALLLSWAALGPAAAQAPGDPGAEEKIAKQATEKPNRPEVSASVDMLSQYIFRGIAFSRHSVVFQPSMTISYRGLAVNIWGNFDTHEKNPFGIVANRNQAKWNETDLTVSYSREVIKNLTLTGGFIYFALDGNNAPFDSFEIFGTASYAFPWFEVFFEAYKEIANIPGWYLNWGITRSFELPINIKFLAGKPSLDLLASWSAELSNSSGAFPTADGSKYNSLNAGLVSAGLNIPVHSHVTITPKVQFWYNLGGQSTHVIRNASWDGTPNHIVGGVSASTSF